MARPEQADNLLKAGLLHEEAADIRQVAAFLQEAADLFAASKIPQVPSGVRYRNAYDAAFALGMAGLRHFGLRPSQKEGSRNITIGSLAWTADATPEDMRILMQANSRRSEGTYRAGSLNVSEAELTAMLGVVERVLAAAQSKLLRGNRV